jgi:hypothetical protein
MIDIDIDSRNINKNGNNNERIERVKEEFVLMLIFFLKGRNDFA